ncbi:hypothetical protein BC833DRAFT_597706, partial [Globomyces pollinis-pini]
MVQIAIPVLFAFLVLADVHPLLKRNEEFQGLVTNDFPHLLGYDRLNAWMDKNVDPCDDFYHYSCGGFQERYSKFRETDVLSLMGKSNQLLMHSILKQEKDALASTPQEKDIFFKTKDYYLSCQNRHIIEDRGMDPIKPMFKNIVNLVNSERNLPTLFGALQTEGVNVLFQSRYSKVESKTNDDLRLLFFPATAYKIQSGTVEKVFNVYKQHGMIESNLDVQSTSAKVAALENKVAAFLHTLNRMRDSTAVDSPDQFQRLEDFSRETQLPWRDMLKTIKIENVENVHVFGGKQPWMEMFEEFKRTDREDLKYYLLWRLATAHFNKLPKQQRDLWGHEIHPVSVKPNYDEVDDNLDIFLHDCVEETGKYLKYLSGHLFVKYALNETQKASANDMIKNLFDSFRERTKDLDWLDESSKNEAILKLDNMVKVVGYPDWLSNPTTVANHYRPLKFKPDHYFENAVEAQVFTALIPNIEQSRHKALDRANVYFGYPWQLNAFHLTDIVLIQINSGILQRPLYSALNPVAMNYGAIGSILAHEITHGFDSIGSQLDANGVRRQWMSKKSHQSFVEKSKCFVDQYNNMKLKMDDTGLFLTPNGKKSLPENMADNGGLMTSFAAFSKLAKGKDIYSKQPNQPFSDAQAFFLSYGQAWCSRR